MFASLPNIIISVGKAGIYFSNAIFHYSKTSKYLKLKPRRNRKKFHLNEEISTPTYLAMSSYWCSHEEKKGKGRDKTIAATLEKKPINALVN